MKDTPQPRDFGFDYQYGLSAWVKNSKVEKSGSGHLYPDNMYRNNEPVGETFKFSAELVSDEAIRWISQDNEPFFLLLTYSEVHTPIASPANYTRKYDQFLTEESRGNPWLYYFDWASRPHRGKGEYYANITYLDAQLDRVLGVLKREKKLDNTLLIFSSDNGPVTAEPSEPWELSMAGETGGLRGKKRYLFEGGIRVPAIIRFPGLTTPGTVLNTPVTALDLLPTIAEITGASVPNDRPIDGHSLVNLLRGGVLDRAGPLYWSIPTPDGMEYAIRSGNWKLILDGSGTPRYLFNLAEDFYEVHNKLTSHPDRVAELEKQFNRYRRDIDSDPIRRARET
jgi:arylsulfatase A-like enzyme